MLPTSFIPSLRPYCELVLRSGIEPLNSLSNIAFLLVAIWILRSYRSTELKLTGVLTFLLGGGSVLWHASRSVPSYFAETVPLAFLLILLAYLVFRKYHKYAFIAGFLLIAITYFILEYFFTLADPGLSEIYFAIIIILFGIITLHYIAKKERTTYLLIAALIFTAGYTLRQLDQFFCHFSVFYYGTHWMWHLLCAGAIYFVVLFLEKSHLSLRK